MSQSAGEKFDLNDVKGLCESIEIEIGNLAGVLI